MITSENGTENRVVVDLVPALQKSAADTEKALGLEIGGQGRQQPNPIPEKRPQTEQQQQQRSRGILRKLHFASCLKSGRNAQRITLVHVRSAGRHNGAPCAHSSTTHRFRLYFPEYAMLVAPPKRFTKLEKWKRREAEKEWKKT